MSLTRSRNSSAFDTLTPLFQGSVDALRAGLLLSPGVAQKHLPAWVSVKFNHSNMAESLC